MFWRHGKGDFGTQFTNKIVKDKKYNRLNGAPLHMHLDLERPRKIRSGVHRHDVLCTQ